MIFVLSYLHFIPSLSCSLHILNSFPPFFSNVFLIYKEKLAKIIKFFVLKNIDGENFQIEHINSIIESILKKKIVTLVDEMN